MIRTGVSTRMLAMGSLVATAALWGASAPLVKQLVETMPPCTLAVLRLAIAVVVLLPVLWLRGKRPRLGRPAVLLGVSGVAASHLLQNLGMERMPAGPAAAVLLAGTVVLTALLGWLVLGERCSTPVLMAIAGCGIGVVLVSMVSGVTSMAFPLVGLLLMLGSALAWAVYAVVGRQSFEGDGLEVTAGALLVGLVTLLPFMLWERPDASTFSLNMRDLVALIVLGGIVTAGSYLSWSYGIQHLPANEASVLCSVEPAFGLVFAWLLLHEGISLSEAVGAAVIVASCALVAIGERAPEASREQRIPATVTA